MTRFSSALSSARPRAPTTVALRWPGADAATATQLDDARGAFLDDARGAFRRSGLDLAVEVALDAGEPAAAPAAGITTAPTPVVGLRVPLEELERDTDVALGWNVEDGPARRMTQLRSLRSRRLVYELARDAPELEDPTRARELGRRLDGVATRFQGQGFELGLALASRHGVERGDTRVGDLVAALVALVTQITSPAFFLALPIAALRNLLEEDWGRALAPLVRQVCWPLAPRDGEGLTADGVAPPRALEALENLAVVVLVPDRAADPDISLRRPGRGPAASAGGLGDLGSRIEAVIEALRKTSVEGLSLPRSLP
jgi:hypothetical protein